VEGGEPRRVTDIEPADRLTQWSSDGRYLYVTRQGQSAARVDRVEIATGRRTLWKEITLADRAGITGVGPVVITPDGKYYAYRYGRSLSDLYLVEGLR
jgi:hypothetical protein